ncbi:MAG: hypothetical protein ACR2L1_04410 [Pyrinomonadaceae bacterium]
MKNLEEKKRMRFLFLEKIYELKNEGGFQHFKTESISRDINISANDGFMIAEYLEGEGLLQILDGECLIISITHKGIVEVERALSKPDKPTEYFPAVTNYINVEQMHNSQIMQSSTAGNQTFNIIEPSSIDLSKFIELFEQKISELHFKSQEDRNEAIVEVQTIKTQLTFPRPKELVIQESRKTLRNILEGMTGSVLATELLKYLLGAN